MSCTPTVSVSIFRLVVIGVIVTAAVDTADVAAQSVLAVPTSFPTIQDAVDAAQPGDVVEVSPGTYVENVVVDKAIHVRSRDGAAVTTIRPPMPSLVVDLNAAAGLATLEGFTIRDGGGVIGPMFGGVACRGRSVVRRCVVTENSFYGIHATSFFDVAIEECVVRDNFVAHGIAVERTGTATNVVIRNTLVVGHTFAGIVIEDFGLPTPWTVLVDGCTVSDNATLPPNPIAPSAGLVVTASSGLLAAVRNSILWGNVFTDVDVDGAAAVGFSHSDVGIATTIVSGPGVFSADPQFVDAMGGDYHLLVTSPCRNAGGTPSIIDSHDFEGHVRVVEGVLDIGADEYCLAGSQEGLIFESFVNGGGHPTACMKSVTAGDTLTISVRTVNPLWEGEVFMFGVQAHAPNAPLSPAGFPELHINALGGFVATFGAVSATPWTQSFAITSIPIPLTLRYQVVVATAVARNGYFVSSGTQDYAFD